MGIWLDDEAEIMEDYFILEAINSGWLKFL